MSEPNISERQRRWFESVRAGLERETGKSLADWIKIAQVCPEIGERARLQWFKDNHGLLKNRAIYVLAEAFPPDVTWRDGDALIDRLWTDPGARKVFAALDERAMALDGVIRTARKGYTAWARNFQFAASRPLKGGGVMLGLAVQPDADLLEARGADSWSERLRARCRLAQASDVGDRIEGLLRAAWARS